MSAERDTLAADIAACRRCPMGEKDFDSASGEGAALSTGGSTAFLKDRTTSRSVGVSEAQPLAGRLRSPRLRRA